MSEGNRSSRESSLEAAGAIKKKDDEKYFRRRLEIFGISEDHPIRAKKRMQNIFAKWAKKQYANGHLVLKNRIRRKENLDRRKYYSVSRYFQYTGRRSEEVDPTLVNEGLLEPYKYVEVFFSRSTPYKPVKFTSDCVNSSDDECSVGDDGKDGYPVEVESDTSKYDSEVEERAMKELDEKEKDQKSVKNGNETVKIYKIDVFGIPSNHPINKTDKVRFNFWASLYYTSGKLRLLNREPIDKYVRSGYLSSKCFVYSGVDCEKIDIDEINAGKIELTNYAEVIMLIPKLEIKEFISCYDNESEENIDALQEALLTEPCDVSLSGKDNDDMDCDDEEDISVKSERKRARVIREEDSNSPDAQRVRRDGGEDDASKSSKESKGKIKEDVMVY